mgnify:CR=1 FL=1
MGVQFHRQVPLLDYIVDFYCHEIQLAIEIDGSSHDTKFEEDFKLKNNLFLSVTGHVFANAELYETFNNALCNDWYIPLNKYAVNKLSGRHQYRESYADNYIERVGSILERFTETELDDLHVENNNLTDILSQYSSSFGYRYI